MKPLNSPRNKIAGFSALEMLGVFAVMAIIFAIVAESMQKRIRQAIIDGEVATLRTYSERLQDGILRTRQIPDASTWVSYMMTEAASTSDQVTNNFPGNRRRFLVDPNFQVAANNAGATPGPPPWTQSVDGTSEPQNVRVMWVSSLGAALPSSIGGSTGTNSFNTIWNAADNNQNLGTIGKDDIIVQRLDLKSLFVHVGLNVNDRGITASYKLADPDDIGYIGGPCPFHFWVLKDTPLSLVDQNGVIQFTDVVKNPVSYSYEKGRWLSSSVHGVDTVTGTFATAANNMAYSDCPPVNSRQFGASSAAVVQEAYSFMVAYRQWIAAGRPTGNPLLEGSRAPTYRALVDAQTRLSDISLNLQTP